ncbi:MAG: transposase [Chitinophagaceae bacterium]
MQINSSEGFKIGNQHNLHFITSTIVDWVDLFTRQAYRDIIIDNFRFYQQQRSLEVYAYVIMSNHLHFIVRQPEGQWKLSDTIRDFKKMTAKLIIERVLNEPESRRDWIIHRFQWNARQRNNRGAHQVWTDDNHPEELWSREFFEQKCNYIHMNPVRACLVEEPQHWRYSSASDLVNNTPLLKLHGWD